MTRNRHILEKIFFTIACAIIGAIIALEIITVIEYGNLPSSEIPTWVLWLWFKV